MRPMELLNLRYGNTVMHLHAFPSPSNAAASSSSSSFSYFYYQFPLRQQTKIEDARACITLRVREVLLPRRHNSKERRPAVACLPPETIRFSAPLVKFLSPVEYGLQLVTCILSNVDICGADGDMFRFWQRSVSNFAACASKAAVEGGIRALDLIVDIYFHITPDPPSPLEADNNEDKPEPLSFFEDKPDALALLGFC